MLPQQTLVKIRSIFLAFLLTFFLHLIQIGIGHILIDILYISGITHFEGPVSVLDQSRRRLPDLLDVWNV